MSNKIEIITYTEAVEVSKQIDLRNKERFEFLIEEIKSSSISMLDANDIRYYAAELTQTDPTGKKWEPNEVRRILIQNNPDENQFSVLDTFDFYNDDIIDFY